ncbi:MAG: hypothetical protein AAEJ04_06410, partial [Planctomycetota bacterium]
NGTFVNGNRVEVLRIEEGQLVELGSVCLLLIGVATDLLTLNLDSLRNPDRIAELIQVASDETSDLPMAGEELERSALRSPDLLAEMASDHLIDELVTLLIRNHMPVRDALTHALDRMISEKILENSSDRDDLRAQVQEIVQQELESFRSAEDEGNDRC